MSGWQGHKWDPVERRLERAEERIGLLEDRLSTCADSLEFALTFYRAAFNDDDAVQIHHEWVNELEVKLSHALSEARRR